MSRTSRPRVALATGLTLGTATAGLLLAPAAFAADTTLPALAVSGGTVAVGEYMTISGTGCTATGQAENQSFGPVVYLDGRVSAADQPAVIEPGSFDGASGTWSMFVRFKAGSEGVHEIDAYCSHYNSTGSTGRGVYPAVSVTVTAAAGTTGTTDTTDTEATETSDDTAATATPAAAASTEWKAGAVPNTPGIAATKTSATTAATPAPGTKVVRVYRGFKPFEEVTVTLHSTPVQVARVPADANGVVTVEFTVPAGTPIGAHTLELVGNMGSHFEDALTVAAATTTASGDNLAYTGASIAMPLMGGSVLVAAGAGALVVGRRRRAAGAPQA